VEIVGIEIAGDPSHRFDAVEVTAGGRAERSHELVSGTLAVGVVAGEELVDAVVNVFPATGGQAIAAGRSYTAANSNPKRFDLAPGRYRVTVKPVRLPGATQREAEVEIQAGEETEHRFDYGGS
jgi:hypothetical protein